MWWSSDPGRRARALAILISLAAWPSGPVTAGIADRAVSVADITGNPPPAAPPARPAPMPAGPAAEPAPELAEVVPLHELRASRASSVLRCFQAGHLVYEGYDLHVRQPAAQALELAAQPGGSVQLLDLQHGLCVLENRVP